MAPGNEGSVTCWLDELRAGEGEAARQLWERYFARLVQLARSELAARRRAAVEDEEDAARAPSTASAAARREGDTH